MAHTGLLKHASLGEPFRTLKLAFPGLTDIMALLSGAPHTSRIAVLEVRVSDTVTHQA